jgi:hypothetical protein
MVMAPELPQATPEETISIPKSEYDHLCELAVERSFWIEALGNPEGSKSLKEFIQGVLQTGLTLYGDKILKGQLYYHGFRTTALVLLFVLIVWISWQLVMAGKLDAGAFTFLIGTIVGYAISYLTKTD